MCNYVAFVDERHMPHIRSTTFVFDDSIGLHICVQVASALGTGDTVLNCGGSQQGTAGAWSTEQERTRIIHNQTYRQLC